MVCLAFLLTLAGAPAERFITAEALKAHVALLADDALEGRGPATAGDALARRYLASAFGALGFPPALPGGSWQQPFDLVGVTGHPDALAVRAAGGKAASLACKDEFIAVSGHQDLTSKLDAAELEAARARAISSRASGGRPDAGPRPGSAPRRAQATPSGQAVSCASLPAFRPGGRASRPGFSWASGASTWSSRTPSTWRPGSRS